MIKIRVRFIEAHVSYAEYVLEIPEASLFSHPQIPLEIWHEIERSWPKIDEVNIKFVKGDLIDVTV